MPQLGVGLFIGDTDGDSIVGPVIDGVIMAEDGAYIITESGVDKLAFEPTSNTSGFQNSDGSLIANVTGSDAVVSWTRAGASVVGIKFSSSSDPDQLGKFIKTISTQSVTVDLSIDFSQGETIYAWLFEIAPNNEAGNSALWSPRLVFNF